MLRAGKDGINCIYPVGDRIYVCADEGFGYFVNNDYSQVYGLVQDGYLSSMLVDYEGNFWISSSRMGLLYMGRGKFTDFNNRYDVPESSTNCIAQFGGKKYIGTDNGLIVLDRTNRVVNSDQRISSIVDYLRNHAEPKVTQDDILDFLSDPIQIHNSIFIHNEVSDNKANEL